MAKFLGTSDTYVAGQLTLPKKYYTSEKIFEKEKKNIFNGWICAGHISKIPNAGDFFLFKIFDENMIIVRNKKGEVNALYNVCRHRGTVVCQNESGNGKSFQCPYHAWTYDLDGKLIGAPFMKDVAGFDFKEHPLGSAPVYVWQGFIFISLSDNPKPFEKQYKELFGRFDKWKMGEALPYKKEVYETQTNWKYVFQNFNECYHCPTAHPLLNSRIEYTGSKNDLTEGIVLGGYFDIKAESMTGSGMFSALPFSDLGSDINRAYYYTVVPNLLLNIHPEYVMYHLVTPISHNRTVVTSEWLFNKDAFGRDDFHPDDAYDFWHLTNQQDWDLTKIAQLGVVSKAYKRGWYSPRESLLEAFDRYYLKVMSPKKMKK